MWTLNSNLQNMYWITDPEIRPFSVSNPRYCWPTGESTFLDLGTAITLCDQFNMRDYGKLGDDDVVSG